MKAGVRQHLWVELVNHIDTGHARIDPRVGVQRRTSFTEASNHDGLVGGLYDQRPMTGVPFTNSRG